MSQVPAEQSTLSGPGFVSTPGFSSTLGQSTSAFSSFNATPAPAAGSTPTVIPAAATGTSTAVPPPPNAVAANANTESNATLNFRQFESIMAKMVHDADEQENQFMAQATKANYYDQILQQNARKISHLSQVVENVKRDQQRVESTLDLAKETQQELEACIEILEESLPKTREVSSELQERTRLFDAALKLDDELMQMSADLMEVINHANHKNKTDSTDPVTHIVGVMNQHTDTLQWVDQSTEVLKKELDNLSKAHRDCRRGQQRVVQFMYNSDKN